MVGRQQPAGAVRRDHGGRDPLGELSDDRAGIRAQRSAAGPDQGPVGRLDQPQRLGEVGLRHGGCSVGGVRRRRVAAGPFGGVVGHRRAEQVGGDAQVDRPARGPQGRRGRGDHVVVHVGGRGGGGSRLGDGHEHRRLVAGLVQHTAVDTVSAKRRRDVGRDQQHRRAGGHRLSGRAHGVGRAGPRGHHGHPQAARGPRVAVGGVDGRLLVAHADQPDARPGDGLPHREVVHARQPEDHPHVEVLQRLDQGGRARTCVHARLGGGHPLHDPRRYALWLEGNSPAGPSRMGHSGYSG
jgi:hypothetical protein